jgi:hypothetical protein
MLRPDSRTLGMLLAASLLGNWFQWHLHEKREEESAGKPGPTETGTTGRSDGPPSLPQPELAHAHTAARVSGRERALRDEEELAKSAPTEALELAQARYEGND